MFGLRHAKSYKDSSPINQKIYWTAIKMGIVYPVGKYIHQRDFRQISKACRGIRHGDNAQVINYANNFQLLTRTKIKALATHPKFFNAVMPLIEKKGRILMRPKIERINDSLNRAKNRQEKYEDKVQSGKHKDKYMKKLDAVNDEIEQDKTDLENCKDIM